MAKKRKVIFSRLLLVIVILVSILLALFFGIKALINSFDSNKDKPADPIEEVDNIKIELIDYEIYKTNLDFNFSIVEIKITDDSNVVYSLNDIFTSESINLSEINEYKEKLVDIKVNIDKLDVVNRIYSNTKEYTFKLFVPFIDSNNVFRLTFGENKTLKIDPSIKNKDIKDLIEKSNNEIIEDDHFDIKISSAKSDTTIMNDGNYEAIPSSRKVYTYVLEVNYASANVQLLEAKFKDENGNEYEALGSEYTSLSDPDLSNMINSTLIVNNKYLLMFMVISSDSEPLSYSGELMLRFSSSDEFYSIKSELN